MSAPSAEKPLRGEPTARTILQVFAAQAAEISPSMADDRPLYAYGSAPKITVGDFRRAAAYLSTRAPAEEALIEAGYARANDDSMENLEALDEAALALPVEGRAPDAELVICAREPFKPHRPHSCTDRPGSSCIAPSAPDASHEKKLGKKGAKQ